MLALAIVLEIEVNVLFFRNLCYIIVGIIRIVRAKPQRIDFSDRVETVFFEFIRRTKSGWDGTSLEIP